MHHGFGRISIIFGPFSGQNHGIRPHFASSSLPAPRFRDVEVAGQNALQSFGGELFPCAGGGGVLLGGTMSFIRM